MINSKKKKSILIHKVIVIYLVVFALCPYFVNAIVSVSLLWAVFAVLSTFAAAHNSNWFAFLPVLGLSPFFVIDRNVAVQSQCPAHSKGNMQCLVRKLLPFKINTL